MREKTISWRFLILGGLMPLCLLLIVIAYGYKEKTEGLMFNLDGVSAFEIDEQLRGRFVRGQLGDCGEQPNADVRAYPAFKSGKPLYGSVWFASKYGEKNLDFNTISYLTNQQEQARGTTGSILTLTVTST